MLKGVRLFISLMFFFYFFSFGYILKNQIICHFRGGYAYSRGYVCCFCQMLQGLRLFRSLEYLTSLIFDYFLLFLLSKATLLLENIYLWKFLNLYFRNWLLDPVSKINVKRWTASWLMNVGEEISQEEQH